MPLGPASSGGHCKLIIIAAVWGSVGVSRKAGSLSGAKLRGGRLEAFESHRLSTCIMSYANRGGVAAAASFFDVFGVSASRYRSSRMRQAAPTPSNGILGPRMLPFSGFVFCAVFWKQHRSFGNEF